MNGRIGFVLSDSIIKKKEKLKSRNNAYINKNAPDIHKSTLQLEFSEFFRI